MRFTSIATNVTNWNVNSGGMHAVLLSVLLLYAAQSLPRLVGYARRTHRFALRQSIVLAQTARAHR
ncbi:hypothetical protein RBSWK_02993 [Rhodopirellula baltica SWK14]|uniref:Uncharacterized protein n=1 Tax=Rhodopirellula baltica SWK14 TaxID=993516 RepID=L7CHP2_RHOBT|nr:hypothetical protein RBSWK_02993 [Rhodopirellula baltica SWK14]